MRRPGVRCVDCKPLPDSVLQPSGEDPAGVSGRFVTHRPGSHPLLPDGGKGWDGLVMSSSAFHRRRESWVQALDNGTGVGQPRAFFLSRPCGSPTHVHNSNACGPCPPRSRIDPQNRDIPTEEILPAISQQPRERSLHHPKTLTGRTRAGGRSLGLLCPGQVSQHDLPVTPAQNPPTNPRTNENGRPPLTPAVPATGC